MKLNKPMEEFDRDREKSNVEVNYAKNTLILVVDSKEDCDFECQAVTLAEINKRINELKSWLISYNDSNKTDYSVGEDYTIVFNSYYNGSDNFVHEKDFDYFFNLNNRK